MNKTIPALTVVLVASGIALAACGSSSPAAAPVAPTSAATGPFQLRLTGCSVQSSMGTPVLTATVTVKNISNSVTASPDVGVNFDQGSDVVASNYNEPAPVISPGQSTTVQVQAVGSNSQDITTGTCQGSEYWADPPGSVGASGTAYTW